MSRTKKDPAAVSLGRRGGLKGGPARAAKLTPEQRSEIARKAALCRWIGVALRNDERFVEIGDNLWKRVERTDE